MAIAKSGSVAATPAGNAHIPLPQEGVAASGKNFAAIFDRIAKEFSPIMKDISLLSKQMGITKLELTGKSALSPQQLLGFQVKVSELQLKTELLSKAADSALQLTKKLQSPQ